MSHPAVTQSADPISADGSTTLMMFIEFSNYSVVSEFKTAIGWCTTGPSSWAPETADGWRLLLNADDWLLIQDPVCFLKTLHKV